MKNIAYLVGAYLIIVGVAMVINQNSGDSPNADAVASLPSLGSAYFNIGLGVAAILLPKYWGKIA